MTTAALSTAPLPTELQTGHRRHTVLDSPVGALTLVASGSELAAIYFPDHSHAPDPAGFGDRDEGVRDETVFAEPIRQLTEYFDGSRTVFDLPLAPVGNAFQQRVWALLRAIPYGETRTYGELAAQLGAPRLARAVGAANGRNPLSIVVPCHRVVGAGGKLTGYAGGLARKAQLLALESRVAGAGVLF